MPEVVAVPGRASAKGSESSQLGGSQLSLWYVYQIRQLSKLFSLEMHQTRWLMTQTEKQGKKHRSFQF